MSIVYAMSDSITFDSESALFDRVDMVFIGMPIETFTDGESKYYDLDGNEVSGDEKYFSSYTVRDVKVVEVLKGDPKADTVPVGERGAVSQTQDSEKIIAGATNTIAKKNVKYIYYVNYSDTMGFYVIHADNGKINVDQLDQACLKSVNEERLAQVRERYTEQLEKYDRSDELKD